MPPCQPGSGSAAGSIRCSHQGGDKRQYSTANPPRQLRSAKAVPIRAGPSNSRDAASSGSGGTRLAPPTSARVSGRWPAWLARLGLDSAQDKAAARVRVKPASSCFAPWVEAISHKPTLAHNKPTKTPGQCARPATARPAGVKNACACNTTEASHRHAINHGGKQQTKLPRHAQPVGQHIGPQAAPDGQSANPPAAPNKAQAAQQQRRQVVPRPI